MSKDTVDISPKALLNRMREDILNEPMPDNEERRLVWLTNHIQDAVQSKLNSLDQHQKLTTYGVVQAYNLAMCTLLVGSVPSTDVLVMATKMCISEFLANIARLNSNKDCIIKIKED